jgi:hypothetical protein
MVLHSFPERSEHYNDIAMTLLDNPESLSAIDYGVHFTAKSSAWRNGDVKNYTTTFFPIEDPDASNTDTPEELIINLVGEVASEGSELGACGNAWLRPTERITDKTSVKDVLVITVPTEATPSLAILYENQVRTLEGIYEKIELPVPKVPYILHVQTLCSPMSQPEKVTHCTGQAGDGALTITIVFPSKYRVGPPFSGFPPVDPHTY